MSRAVIININSLNIIETIIQYKRKKLSWIFTVTAIAITKVIMPTMINTIPRPLAKSGPTEDILRQCGHRARALFNVLN